MDCVWPVVERTEAANYVGNSGWQLGDQQGNTTVRENMGLLSDYEPTEEASNKQAVRTKRSSQATN